MYDKTEFFKSYMSRATEKKILVKAMGRRLNPLRHTSKILDLGCHDGTLMRTIVDHYKNRIPNQVKIVSVDPSEMAIQELLAHDFTKEYSVEAIVDTAENYFLNQKEYFDWIIASQCLYWSPKLELIISQIHKNSESSLIVLRGKKGIFEIQSQFKEALGNKQEQLYTADDIEHALIAQNIPFNKECHQSFIELPNQDEPVFNWLIAFFLQNDESKIAPELMTDVKRFITQKSINNTLQHDVVFFWLGQAIH